MCSGQIFAFCVACMQKPIEQKQNDVPKRSVFVLLVCTCLGCLVDIQEKEAIFASNPMLHRTRRFEGGNGCLQDVVFLRSQKLFTMRALPLALSGRRRDDCPCAQFKCRLECCKCARDGQQFCSGSTISVVMRTFGVEDGICNMLFPCPAHERQNMGSSVETNLRN